MKIKTMDQLIDKINEDLAWRKKELSLLLSDVNSAKNRYETTSIRSAIVLLYAHWEGFIKNASEYYIRYVAVQGLSYQNLSLSFVALALKNKIKDFEDTSSSSKHLEFLDFMSNRMNESPNIPVNVIDTQSNLNSKVLQNILLSIGIDYRPYSLKANLIDEQLLKHRNNIAHGQILPFNKNDYLNLHAEITQMIEQINNDIQNSAVQQLFKREVVV